MTAIYSSYFKLHVLRLRSLTPVTYLCKLLGIHSLVAFLQVAMFSLFTVIGFNAQANEHHHETMSEAQPQVISATGVVKGIDLESKKITIHHDPIAAVNWPEMTMRFTITPQTKMSEIKTGDKVAFNFVQQGNLSLLQDIKVSQ